MGVELLAGERDGRLSAIAVLTPAAPWRPWCFDRGSAGQGEMHGQPPQLFGLRDEPYRRETREQAAAKRRAAQRRSLQVRAEETRPVTGRPGSREGRNGTNEA